MAADETEGHVKEYTSGEGTGDGTEVLQVFPASGFDTFTIGSVTGSFRVFVSMDGVNMLPDPIGIVDLTDLVSAKVSVGVAGKAYGFAGAFKKIEIKQSGATDVENLGMICRNSNKY